MITTPSSVTYLSAVIWHAIRYKFVQVPPYVDKKSSLPSRYSIIISIVVRNIGRIACELNNTVNRMAIGLWSLITLDLYLSDGPMLQNSIELLMKKTFF